MIRRALFFPALALLLACANAQAGDIAHVARPGDTPSQLARIYHVPLATILTHNKGLDPCRIKVGDVILVPRPSPEPSGQGPAPPAAVPDEEPIGVRYEVVPGDSPAAIAARFGIPLEDLSRINPGLDPRKLAVGRVLAIPPATACPPPAVPVTQDGESTKQAAPLVMDFQ